MHGAPRYRFHHAQRELDSTESLRSRQSVQKPPQSLRLLPGRYPGRAAKVKRDAEQKCGWSIACQSLALPHPRDLPRFGGQADRRTGSQARAGLTRSRLAVSIGAGRRSSPSPAAETGSHPAWPCRVSASGPGQYSLDHQREVRRQSCQLRTLPPKTGSRSLFRRVARPAHRS